MVSDERLQEEPFVLRFLTPTDLPPLPWVDKTLQDRFTFCSLCHWLLGIITLQTENSLNSADVSKLSSCFLCADRFCSLVLFPAVFLTSRLTVSSADQLCQNSADFCRSFYGLLWFPNSLKFKDFSRSDSGFVSSAAGGFLRPKKSSWRRSLFLPER